MARRNGPPEQDETARSSGRTADEHIYIWKRGGRPMTTSRQDVQEEEPMGIVISRGSRAEPAPRVWAYVWGPVPEGDDSTRDVKAA
jgi:hypothetical protein